MLTLDIAGRSHRGSVREENEDAIDWWRSADGSRAVALLADGMGGYAGGAQASRMAVSLCMGFLRPLLEQPSVDSTLLGSALVEAFMAANDQIRDARERLPHRSQMGTTLVCALVFDDQALIGHVGDSRCYHWTAGAFWQSTRDDTVVQNMIDDGSIAPEQASRVPFRHVLTKALGAEAQVLPTMAQLNLRPGDALLLCSDGLVGALDPERWSGLDRADPQQVATRMVDAGLENGADDNLSVIWLQTQPFK